MKQADAAPRADGDAMAVRRIFICKAALPADIACTPVALACGLSGRDGDSGVALYCAVHSLTLHRAGVEGRSDQSSTAYANICTASRGIRHVTHQPQRESRRR